MHEKIRKYSEENKDFKIITNHGEYHIKGAWTLKKEDETIIHFEEMSPRALNTEDIIAVREA